MINGCLNYITPELYYLLFYLNIRDALECVCIITGVSQHSLLPSLLIYYSHLLQREQYEIKEPRREGWVVIKCDLG